MTFSGSGAGTSGDPYQITNWEQLQEVNDDLSAHYILMNDLDENTSDYDTYASSTANSGEGWEPIGDDSTPFLGSFDGQKFTISDLFIDRPTTTRQGLFGQMGTADSSSTGTIKNITVSNFDITTGVFGGCLVGAVRDRNAEKVVLVENAHVVDSSILFSVNSTSNSLVHLGGLIGLSECKVINCSSINTVCNANNTNTSLDARIVGGLIGTVQTGLVENCFAKGCSIYANLEYGGLIGRLFSDSVIGDALIRNCFSDCTIFNSITTGTHNGWGSGFIGSLAYATSSTITVDKCYDVSDISNTTDGRQFIGVSVLISGTVVLSNNFCIDSGTAEFGSTIKTVTEMRDRDTYTNLATEGLDEAWDMADENVYDDAFVWGISSEENNGYPFLQSLISIFTITTQPATNISYTTVTLNGTVTDYDA